MAKLPKEIKREDLPTLTEEEREALNIIEDTASLLVNNQWQEAYLNEEGVMIPLETIPEQADITETEKEQILYSYSGKIQRTKTKVQSIVFSNENKAFLGDTKLLGVNKDNSLTAELGLSKVDHIEETPEGVAIVTDARGKQKLDYLGLMTKDPYFCGNVFNALCGVAFDKLNQIRGKENDLLKVPLSSTDVFFTESMLYKYLTKNTSLDVPPKMKGLIAQALDAMNTTFVYLDYTDHALKAGAPEGTVYLVRETIIHTRKEIVIINGKRVEGYYLPIIPPLMRYGITVGAIDSLAFKEVKVIGDNTVNTINMQSYISNYIKNNSYSKKANHFCELKYSTIFSNSNITTTEPKQKTRYKDYILKVVLPAYKKSGFIKGFKELPVNTEKTNEKRGKIRMYLTEPELEEKDPIKK